MIDYHVHFTGCLPLRFIRERALVSKHIASNKVVSAVEAVTSEVSLFEALLTDENGYKLTASYESFFLAYNWVHQATRPVDKSDYKNFFFDAGRAIAQEQLTEGKVKSELIIGVMDNLSRTLVRAERLISGYQHVYGSPEHHLGLRLTLIRNDVGEVSEAKLFQLLQLLKSQWFKENAKYFSGFDVSGFEKESQRTLNLVSEVSSCMLQAEQDTGHPLSFSIHLAEKPESKWEISGNFWRKVINSGVNRIVHGYGILDELCKQPALVEGLIRREIEFDICPSAANVIRHRPIDFSKLIRFIDSQGIPYNVGTDNPVFLGTCLEKELNLIKK